MGAIRSEVRDTYLSENPADEKLLLPFLDGFFVTWARVRQEYNTILKVFFLSPEDFMKESFGFENEIMLVYAPYSRMEPRTLQAIDQIYSQSPAKGRVETLNYFLVSDALDVRQWLDSYTSSRQESRIIVSFTSEELLNYNHDPYFVRNKLTERFFGRDLFNYSLPLVEDTYFFGRQQLIMEYLDAIKRKENKAIFGLRKTGKTSFLFKIRRLIESEGIAKTLYVDCKQPNIRKSRWYELLEEIAEKLSKDLGVKHVGKYTDRKASSVFFSFVSSLAKKGINVCLMFDEIEYISFIAKLDKHWQSEFVDFWQTLWSCQSQLKNFSFVISGVNPSVVEIDTVNGVQNPLFGIVPHKYLTGFSESEVRTMVRSLGKRMGLRFSNECVTAMFHWYGGHPLLTRLACSWMNTILSLKGLKMPITVDEDMFLDLRERCDDELIFYCGHVVSELKEFYPDEYAMLELFASGQLIDFVGFAEDPVYVKHLHSYGIIGSVHGKYEPTIPVVIRYVGSSLAKRENRLLVYKITPVNERPAWVKRRIEAIISDLRSLERMISNAAASPLFGRTSFPEPDMFLKTRVVDDHDSFCAFVNTCNRCFVESVDDYGRSIGENNYFWGVIKESYADLFDALHRIRVYRNERDHLYLKSNVNHHFMSFLQKDLEGRSPSQVADLHFVLQQRILDNLLLSIQTEIGKLS